MAGLIYFVTREFVIIYPLAVKQR